MGVQARRLGRLGSLCQGGFMELVWHDIDLEKFGDYAVWKPETVEWAMLVDWAKVNDLVRHRPADFPVGDHEVGMRCGRAIGDLAAADLDGLFSLFAEPIVATPHQISSGGHRITAMRAQGVRWALGQCHREDVGTSVEESHAYLP